MTESFKVASLKDMGLILHQGHFIGKPELGDALFGGPLYYPKRGRLRGLWERKWCWWKVIWFLFLWIQNSEGHAQDRLSHCSLVLAPVQPSLGTLRVGGPFHPPTTFLSWVPSQKWKQLPSSWCKKFLKKLLLFSYLEGRKEHGSFFTKGLDPTWIGNCVYTFPFEF